MNGKCRLYFLFFLFLSIYPLFSEDDNQVLQTVIIIKPDIIIENSLETVIYAETVALLEFLDASNNIVFLREKFWKSDKKLINYQDSSDLADFYYNTGVSGIVKFLIYESEDGLYYVQLSLFNIYKKKEVKVEYYLQAAALDLQLNGYRDFLKNNILKHFPVLDKAKLAASKYKIPPFVRVNSDYEIMLSGGNGFYFKELCIGSPIYGYGGTTYFNFAPRIKNFSLNFHVDFSVFGHSSPYETYPSTDEYDLSQERSSINIFSTLSFNGWFKNQVFKLGGGTGVAGGRMYNVIEEDDSDDIDIDRLDYLLVFLFISISAQPIKTAIISVDIGSYFSPTHFDQIRFSYIMFYYLRINLKYFIYKGLFIEWELPFYGLGVEENDGGSFVKPYSQLMINLGLGWRFEWNK